MKHLTLILLLALLAFPLVAQDRLLTAAELSQGWFDMTIAGGESLTQSMAVGKACVPVAIKMPASWTTANLTFRAASGSETPGDLYDGATEVNVTAAASRYIVLEGAVFFTVRTLQIRSGTSGTPVNQGAARTLRVICR
jgi:hypothetical protein